MKQLFNKTRICVPILEKTYESALESSKSSITAGADLLELRIDFIENSDPDDVKNLIQEINFPLIATNRRKEENGFFKGSESDRIEILLEAAKVAEIVDIELGTELDYLNKIVKTSNLSIVSYHDFEKTPDKDFLLEIVNKELKLGDMAKFAVMPKTMADTLIVLNVLSEVENTVAISMGDIGSYTRVVAPLFGSPLTFASYETSSAPGQLNIETTRDFINKLSIN
ncbi:MAG: type I 3-dehydroquinate dehydratase [Methanobacterium sp. ERen5]|nr:MAG: type I 3-dehydroquinate dehydratase [Methanobacterium sp. ERen5]